MKAEFNTTSKQIVILNAAGQVVGTLSYSQSVQLSMSLHGAIADLSDDMNGRKRPSKPERRDG